MFGKWRRRQPDEAAEAEPAEQFSEITLFTPGGSVGGSIRVEGRRLSDMLNQETFLSVCVDTARADEANAWRTFGVGEILVASLPPHATHPQRQVHRMRRPVEAQIGPYTVKGIAHLLPGGKVDPYVLRTQQRFLPLTSVRIYAAEIDEQLAVALLNVGTDQITRFVTIE